MHQIFKKVITLLAIVSLFIICSSCKDKDEYLVSEYLDDLSIRLGIETEDSFNSLLNWGYVNDKDKEKLNEPLTFDYLEETISNLIEESRVKEVFASMNKKDDDLISKDDAKEIIDKAVKYANDKHFENAYHYKLGDDDGQEFFDKYGEFEISGDFNLNFDQSEVEFYGEEEKSSYVNNYYELLSSKNNVLYKDGYRISYSFGGQSLSFHISKENKKGKNVYFDASITNINPKFKWKYTKSEELDSYFKVDYNSVVKVGISDGEYDYYKIDLKNIDASSFENIWKSLIKKNDSDEMVSISICTIKTPVPNIPFLYLNMDVGINIYASGKAELSLYNKNQIGFEIKNGNFRLINDSERKDYDAIIGASIKPTIGLNFNLETDDYRLMDIQLDTGVKAKVSSTIHIYDEDGEETKTIKDIDNYALADDVSKNNDNVKACADLSFHWLFDIKLNTYKTLLYKLGFNKTFEILDDDNQIFNNLTHIEDGKFVEKCTRKSSKKTSSSFSQTIIDRIELEKYSLVLKKGENFVVKPLNLPSGYQNSDLILKSSDEKIVKINENSLIAISSGNAKITVSTKDGLYSSYINVIVSYE